MKVAFVHDWLTGMRGGEYVLEAMLELFPEAELFTLIWSRGELSSAIESRKIHTSPLQKIPGIAERYRHFLPVMPWAIEQLDLTGFDLILSSSHCVAKGIKKPAGAVHVSYLHAPMRYMWERFEDYFGPGRASPAVRLAALSCRPFMQYWDRKSSRPENVDRLLTNSRFIADQAERAYGRTVDGVIHPFVQLSRFSRPRKVEDFYLMVGAFAPNKRVDLAIEAFNTLGLKLKIVGSGQDETRLRERACSRIEFLGSLANDQIADLFSRARGFIFPGVEDFGITPLESMAAGCPVIAYGAGGVLETVTEKTGLFFKDPTSASLAEAILRVDSGSVKFDEADCRARAQEFTRERFQKAYLAEVRGSWERAGRSWTAF